MFVKFWSVIFPLDDFHFAADIGLADTENSDSDLAPTLSVHLKDGTTFKFYGPTLDDFEDALYKAKEKDDGY